MRYVAAIVLWALVVAVGNAAYGATGNLAELEDRCVNAFGGTKAIPAHDESDRPLADKVLAAQLAVMNRVKIEWLRGYSPVVFIVESADWDAVAVFAGTPLADDIRGMGICITEGLIRGLPVELLSAAITHETAHLTSGMAVGIRTVAWEHEMDAWAAGILGPETVIAMLKYVLANAPQLKTATDEAKNAVAELETRIRLLEEKFAH